MHTLAQLMNLGLAILHYEHSHTHKPTFTAGFSEMKVKSACLTSAFSLVVLKSFNALPAVVCNQESREDELEGGGGGWSD